MAGPIEEGAHALSGVVDALKGQPALLGSLLLNLAMMGLLYWGLAGASASREKILQQVFDNGKYVQDILSKCVVPDKHSEDVQEPQKHTEVEVAPLPPIQQ
jgi:hypothetical protein